MVKPFQMKKSLQVQTLERRFKNDSSSFHVRLKVIFIVMVIICDVMEVNGIVPSFLM